MPVCYDIFPEYNLVIYVCTGSVTPAQFFATGDQVALDPRLRAKMSIILDFFNADLETTVADLRLAIQKHNESHQKGQALGPTAVLTQSTALRYLGEALKTLSLDSITNFSIFHTPPDALRWLGLPQPEALACWENLRRQS